jgi:hypothetical protein
MYIYIFIYKYKWPKRHFVYIFDDISLKYEYIKTSSRYGLNVRNSGKLLFVEGDILSTKYLLICVIKIARNIWVSGGTAPRLLNLSSRYMLMVSIARAPTGYSTELVRTLCGREKFNSCSVILKQFSLSRTISQTLYRCEVLSAVVGRRVEDLPGLALQEHQLSGQVTLRPCPTCGQNAGLQVMRKVPVL